MDVCHSIENVYNEQIIHTKYRGRNIKIIHFLFNAFHIEDEHANILGLTLIVLMGPVIIMREI